MDQAIKSPLERAKQQVEIISRIQQLRASGLSCRRISAIFQAEGLVGPRGGRWSHLQVWRAISPTQESNPD